MTTTPTHTFWSEISIDEKLIVIRDFYIYRDKTELIRRTIDECRRRRRFIPEPHCVLITGDTGTGKTSLLKQYLAENDPSRVHGVVNRPVVYMELPTRTTIRGAVTRLLRALGDPGADRGNQEARQYRAEILLKNENVEAVLIDEFQHIVEGKGRPTLNDVGNTLKQLSKASRVPFILAGMPDSIEVVNTNRQFGAICKFRYVMGPFVWDDGPGTTEFRQFLVNIDMALPFDNRSDLAGQKMAKRLFDSTMGNLRDLTFLIRIAAERAVSRNAPCIEMMDLAMAYTSEQATSNLPSNPFLGAN